VQVNDVYEIAPLSGGKEGGLARVAALKKEYLRKNPNTFLVMAGDFLSPSVYNSLQYEGKRVRGMQMIDAMNIAGTDLAIFGNHEFDINEAELQDRLNESRFRWIASNAFHKQGEGGAMPFSRTSGNDTSPFPTYLITEVTDSDGTTARIGYIGVTLPFNQADYVSYTDPLETASALYAQIKDSVDAVVAITHQAMEEDIELAEALPGLDLILGGHEHDMRFEKVGDVYITKAHANAKSGYVIKLLIDKEQGTVQVSPELRYLNEAVPLDSATNLVVQKWTAIADKNYATLGFNARQVVLDEAEPLDGRESEIRSHPTNFTRLAVAAMAAAAPEADVVLLNAGAIRVDDMLQMPVTQYDIIRSMPFGGGIREVDMKGSLLLQVLNQGASNSGNGGFLLYNEDLSPVAATGAWQLQGKPVDPAKVYRVAMAEFLLSGKEAGLSFLNPDNPNITHLYDPATAIDSPLADVRQAIVQYLK